METLRELIATLIFMIGAVFIFSLFNEFNWGRFFGGITCFVIAYFSWPSRKRGQRKQDNTFLDIVEFIIELPIEIFMWFLRLVGRIFRNKEGGFDIDVDL